MYHYIDGYNLLFKLGFSEKSLQEQREGLIFFLKQVLVLLKISATVVFDARFSVESSLKGHVDNLEIVYASGGETADDHIVNLLEERKRCRNAIVVTSDNLLAWRSRRKGAITISCEDFVNKISRSYQKRKSRYQAISEDLENFTEKIKRDDEKRYPINIIEKYHQPLVEGGVLFSDLDRYLKIFEERYRKHSS